jgi:aarF domain-containing kinase
MLRTFVRRGAALTVGGTAATITAGTAYAYTDQGAGFRREVKFWSRVFPVVFDYCLQTLERSPYVKYQKLTSSGLYAQDGKSDNDDSSKDPHNSSSYKEKRNKLLHSLHEKHAPRILGVMLDLKGLYIKLGQVMSVTALPIPEQYRILFRTLQSDVPGHEEFESVVKPTLEKELGKPLDELFEHVEPMPCGAASIGQAHKARLKKSITTPGIETDGTDRDVVIKVQYPDAIWQVPADIHCVGDLLSVCVFFGVVEKDDARMSFEEFSRQFLSELDYNRERQNLQTVHQSSLDSESPYYKHNVVIPKVYEEFCTNRIITMRYLPGPTMEAEARRQLEALGIDTSGGISKMIRKAANDAVDQPHEASSGEIVRRITKQKKINHSDDNRHGQKSLSWKSDLPGFIGRFVGFDSILWTVRGFKKFILWSKAITVTSINLVPKIILPLQVAGWADKHQSALTQAERLGEVEAWCKALFDVHGHQIFQLGLFNADPHPGNIVLTSLNNEGVEHIKGPNDTKLNVGLIDYGQCKQLTPEERCKVAQLILSVSRNEPDEVIADRFREMNVGTKNDSTEFLASFARLMFGPFEPKHLKHSWHMNLHKLDKITYFPKELSMVYRTSLLLRGLAVSLQHNFSICEEWKYHAEVAVMRSEVSNEGP